MTAALAQLVAPLPLRRTWIAEQLRPSAASKFLKIFQELAPAKAQAVRGQPGMRIYDALIAHLIPLLPVYEPVFGNWRGANDVTEEAFEHGVPVDFFGFDESGITYETSYDPALALIWWLLPDYYREGEREEIDEPYQTQPNAMLPATLKRFTAALREQLETRRTSLKWAQPPKGRQWKGVWAFLPDMYAYVTHTTGSGLLDYSETIVWEGDEMPPWDVDEVKGLIQDWKRAAPMWEGIKVLVTYIDDDRQRLLDLGLALTGDDATRRALSEPKRKGKTLAQLFTQGVNHA